MERAKQTKTKLHRILIVEDNLDQMHSLAFLLKEMGHTVEFAINGYVAYDAVRRFRPDAVIMDLGLPGMTGYEVAGQIRKDPELMDIKLIAFTGYSDQPYRERALAAGFDDYFVKPVDPVVLQSLFGDAHSNFVR